MDATLVALSPGSAVWFAELTFIGEVILLVWLIGWGGRTGAPRARTADPALAPPVR